MRRRKKRHNPLKKLWGAVLLGRPVNALMVFFATYVGGILAGLPYIWILLPAFSAMFISMGAQAVNDYFDVEIDKKKGQRKVLVSGVLSLKEGKIVWVFYYLVGVILAALASIWHLLVALFAVGLTYLYSRSIQGKKYIGNIVVSFFVALTVVYGGIGGNVWNTVLPAIIIFLANWGREILKDIEDGNVDYPQKVSLFHILGRRWANFLGTYLIFLAVIFSPFPYLLNHLGIYYAGLMLIADLIALFGVAEALSQREARGEKITKVAMIVALIAFGAGAIA